MGVPAGRRTGRLEPAARCRSATGAASCSSTRTRRASRWSRFVGELTDALRGVAARGRFVRSTWRRPALQLEGRAGGVHGGDARRRDPPADPARASVTPTRSTTCSATSAGRSPPTARRARTSRWQPTEQEMLDSMYDREPRRAARRSPCPTGTTARSVAAEQPRKPLRPVLGAEAAELSDAEVNDSFYFTLFPNFHPWGAFNRIVYRFRPNGMSDRRSDHGVHVLSPFPRASGRRPRRVHWLDADSDWTQGPQLGSLARVFNQDSFNLRNVQLGLKARATRPRHVRPLRGVEDPPLAHAPRGAARSRVVNPLTKEQCEAYWRDGFDRRAPPLRRGGARAVARADARARLGRGQAAGADEARARRHGREGRRRAAYSRARDLQDQLLRERPGAARSTRTHRSFSTASRGCSVRSSSS